MNSRNTALDQIKAVACLLIVCHHLAFYGPMADALRPVLPGLLTWLDDYARMAVQIFLVLGGYLLQPRWHHRAWAAMPSSGPH